MPLLSVCLTFDFDAISVWIGSMRSSSPSAISRGEFGVVGARRLLALLRRHDIRSTWFVPGHTIETYPDVCRDVFEAGHEVAHHNYCHENPRTLDEDAERAVLERGRECIRRLTGAYPRGFRSPAWDHSPHTTRLLAELGFVYDSSLMATDFQPAWARTGDAFDTVSAFHFGPEIPVVEIPVDWSLDDWPYFGLNWNSHHVGLRTPGEVLDIWRSEFDYFREDVGQGAFTLTMHPQLMGRGHRLRMLEELITHLQAQPGVAFRTVEEVALAWRAERPLPRVPR